MSIESPLALLIILCEVSTNTIHVSGWPERGDLRSKPTHFQWVCALIGIGMAATAFPDESRVRELVEQMKLRYAHAQQLKQLPNQQQTPATNQQVAIEIFLLANPNLLLTTM